MSSSHKQAEFDRILLAKLFSAAFMDKWQKYKKPLKVGIFKDLVEAKPLDPATGEPISYTRLRRALRAYCDGPKYHRSLLKAGAGSPRIDLTGQVAGVIDGDVIAYHDARLTALNERIAARKAARAARTLPSPEAALVAE